MSTDLKKPVLQLDFDETGDVVGGRYFFGKTVKEFTSDDFTVDLGGAAFTEGFKDITLTGTLAFVNLVMKFKGTSKPIVVPKTSRCKALDPAIFLDEMQLTAA